MTSLETFPILLVDDNLTDIDLMQRAFKRAGFPCRLSILNGGWETLQYLRGDGIYHDREKYPYPALILLDLKMPKVNGFEVLEWIKTQPAPDRPVVIIMTASPRREDVMKVYDLGASAFLVKPGTMNELIHMVKVLADWIQINSFPATTLQ